MNVLVALAWPNHIHHTRARRWFAEARSRGWATCPVTESGFVRVSSNRRVIPEARRPAEAVELLRVLRGLPGHAFWPDDVSPTDEAEGPFTRAVGHRQITDARLVSLAIRRDGAVATFDRELPELVDDPARVVLID